MMITCKKYSWHLVCLVALCFLCSCATTRRSLRLQAKDAFVQGRFAEAETMLSSSQVVGEEKNRLLTLMELGTIAHYAGDYEKSNRFLLRAKDIAKELYTVSVSEQIATGLLNDNSASYAGMDYEVSAIHYYIITNFLLMSAEGKIKAWSMPLIQHKKNTIFEAEQHPERILTAKEQTDFLSKARSEALAWDSFLETIRQRNKGHPYFKDDLLAKLLGAYIHRNTGQSSEKTIAKILYQDARNILVRSYSLFPTFNGTSEKYLDNYSKFAELGESLVKERFVLPTEYYQSLDRFISERSKVSDTKNKVVLILEAGTIPEKTTKIYTVGLSTLFGQIQDPVLRSVIEQLGTHVILETAPSVGVGLVAVALTGAIMGEVEGGPNKPQHISQAIDKAIGFEFKLPSIPKVKTDTEFVIKFTRADGKEFQTPAVIVNPFNDIAYLDVERRAAGIATKTGIRVGLKYLAALIAAITVYQKTPEPEFLKVATGTATWIAGKKLVDATESPDTRAWAMLPMNVAISEIELTPGNYHLTALPKNGGVPFDLGTIAVKNGTPIHLFKRRLFSPVPAAPKQIASK
ncbi:MAG: hypothetical protein HY537_07835 [Deltaproteobacteria bacterium]|nr:hypothetical protein [Deltaproteobacteria bacterium]